MYSLSRLRRVTSAVALAAGVFFLSVVRDASAVTLNFDINSPLQTIAIASGTGGTLDFQLSITDGFGGFTMDAFGPGNVLLGSVALSGDTFFDGVFQDLGNMATPGGVAGFLPNVSIWSLTVAAADLPLSLVVSSALTSFDGNIPQLTVTYDTTLQVLPVSEVPLPAAFPLFASALALLGFARWRRRRAATA